MWWHPTIYWLFCKQHFFNLQHKFITFSDIMQFSDSFSETNKSRVHFTFIFDCLLGKPHGFTSFSLVILTLTFVFGMQNFSYLQKKLKSNGFFSCLSTSNTNPHIFPSLHIYLDDVTIF